MLKQKYIRLLALTHIHILRKTLCFYKKMFDKRFDLNNSTEIFHQENCTRVVDVDAGQIFY